MNATPDDLLTVRAPLRRALAFSMMLHAIVAMGVGLYWEQHTRRPKANEPEVIIEFTTETAAEGEASVVTAPAQTPAPPPVVPKPVEPAAPAVLEPPVKSAEPVSKSSVAPVSAPAPAPVNPKPTGPTAATEKPVVPAPAARDPGPIQMAAPPSSATNQSGVLAQPLYRNNPEPTYPLAARRRRQEGVVLLLVRVTAQGRASHVALKQTSGFKLLDEAASASVLTWNFEPARVGPDAIESDIEVPVRFRLTR